MDIARGLSLRAAYGTLQALLVSECLCGAPSDDTGMIVLRDPSARLPRVLILLLTWVVVAGLFWVDLVGSQAGPTGTLLDAQVATELDLDELRDDVTVISLTEEELPAYLSPRIPRFSRLRTSTSEENPLPTRSLLSKLSVYRL